MSLLSSSVTYRNLRRKPLSKGRLCLACTLLSAGLLLGCASNTLTWEESQAIFSQALAKRYNPGELRYNVINKVGGPTTSFQRSQSGWPPTMSGSIRKAVDYAESTFALSASRVDVYAVFGTNLENNNTSMRPYNDLLFYDEQDVLSLVHRIDR
ncbi:MAG: hypothetical protein ACFCU1_03185 [Sumerlaeia bacterium]